MKIIIEACICKNDEHKKQILDMFRQEFGVEVEVLGSYETLPGHGGSGGRSDVVVRIPDEIVSMAAIHPWHLNGLFRWYDDYLASSRDIVPSSALGKIFGEEKSDQNL